MSSEQQEDPQTITCGRNLKEGDTVTIHDSYHYRTRGKRFWIKELIPWEVYGHASQSNLRARVRSDDGEELTLDAAWFLEAEGRCEAE